MHADLSDQLKKLGCTKQETQVYLTLLKHDALGAKTLAKAVSTLPNAIYRTIRQLNKKGFVKTTKGYPITFQAISTETAIPLFIERQIETLKDITINSTIMSKITQNQNPTAIDILYGAAKIYEQGAALLDQTTKEMLVISIGEPISPDLLLSVNRAVQRGVSIKLIVHKYDASNKQVIENLKKNGYIIRHAPGKGFHIAVYDQKKSLIIINNPENTEERVAIFFNSADFSHALREYFYATWKVAKTV